MFHLVCCHDYIVISTRMWQTRISAPRPALPREQKTDLRALMSGTVCMCFSQHDIQRSDMQNKHPSLFLSAPHQPQGFIMISRSCNGYTVFFNKVNQLCRSHIACLLLVHNTSRVQRSVTQFGSNHVKFKNKKKERCRPTIFFYLQLLPT